MEKWSSFNFTIFIYFNVINEWTIWWITKIESEVTQKTIELEEDIKLEDEQTLKLEK